MIAVGLRWCYRSCMSNNRFISLCMPTFRTSRHRENVTVQSSCPEAVNQTVKSVRRSSLIEVASAVATPALFISQYTPLLAGTLMGNLLR